MYKLDIMYDKYLVVHKVFIMRKLFNMQMVYGGSILENINQFNIATN